MVKAKQTSVEKLPVKKVGANKEVEKKNPEKKEPSVEPATSATNAEIIDKKTTSSKAKVKTKVVEKKDHDKLISAKKDRKRDVENISSQEFTPYKEKKGEEYMSDAMREHFITILKKWRSELVKDMNRTVEHMQDDAANFPDPADRATQEEEFSLELRTRDRERKLIKKIDDTLQLIAENNYGWCESCGVEIGVRRLEARPTATLCIDCKTLAEIKEKQTGL